MQAVLLAAGAGTRLRPITNDIPKAMVPIAGKPMLQILIERLKEVDITNITIVVHYLKEKIMDYFGDGSKFGVHIKYVEQKTMSGSADAVLCGEIHINERFLCIACDSLFEKDLLPRLLKHTSPGVFTCKEVEDGRRYGILVTEGDKVVKIIEKPERPPTNLANFSVYILPKEVFDTCKIVPPGGKGEKWLPEAIQLLIDKGITFEYEMSTDIIDIGTHEQLKEAEELAKKLGL